MTKSKIRMPGHARADRARDRAKSVPSTPEQALINRLTHNEHKRWAEAGKPDGDVGSIAAAVWPMSQSPLFIATKRMEQP